MELCKVCSSRWVGLPLGFGVLFVLWLVGGGGGGDVKFMGALGAWLGPVLIFYVLIGSLVFVAFGSVIVMVLESSRVGVEGVRRRYFRSSRGDAKGRGNSSKKATPEQATRRRLLPFAVPVALATWTILAVAYLAKLPVLTQLVGHG
jgi:prepilin peptidase CpaA